LTKKTNLFLLAGQTAAGFQALKHAFTTALILQHFDTEKHIIFETDSSDYVSARIYSQYDNKGKLHPVPFYSWKITQAECNSERYDMELLAVIRTFEEWSTDLDGAAHPISVISDNENLEYFMSTKELNRRHVW
jgi:hypothetical protein